MSTGSFVADLFIVEILKGSELPSHLFGLLMLVLKTFV